MESAARHLKNNGNSKSSIHSESNNYRNSTEIQQSNLFLREVYASHDKTIALVHLFACFKYQSKCNLYKSVQ